MKSPLLFHTGMRAHITATRDAVRKVLDPARLRWLSFSHFEVDECGALNEWLRLAPEATAACSVVGARVNLADFSERPARELNDGEVCGCSTGSAGDGHHFLLAPPDFLQKECH
ncbi:MAG: hypothetical protein Q8R76_06065 [Candidatus Omnitrophota bacterium]|nr:hypothetical protein [Candidatus Omnitrophota bacterium]